MRRKTILLRASVSRGTRGPNLVVRAGAGIFYDLGYSGSRWLQPHFRILSENDLNTSFPLSNSAAAPPPFKTTPPVSYLWRSWTRITCCPGLTNGMRRCEQGFGNADVLTLTYVGAAGRQLMRDDIYNKPNPEFTGQFDVFRNGADFQLQRASGSVPASADARPAGARVLYLVTFD